jgi:L-ascorbate metabolism protein UlaG (beta-lactamase superfamily)
MRGGRRGISSTVIPAQAGIHRSAVRASEKWVPACAGTTIFLLRVLCARFAFFALTSLAALALLALSGAAWAACTGVVADGGARLWRAAAGDEKAVAIDFLGHASFLIESPQGVKIVTDYNDMIGAPVTPDIVTMKNAHPTHYTDHPDPAIKYVLRGWDPAGGTASHNLEYKDVRVHNVATNLREFGGTRYNGNSIFVFDTADICIAHLGHLHHTLTKTHLAELGQIDIVLVPVDGGFTLNQADMIEVLQQIDPKLAMMMLDRFLARAAEHYKVRQADKPRIVLTRADLPKDPEILLLPGR